VEFLLGKEKRPNSELQEISSVQVKPSPALILAEHQLLKSGVMSSKSPAKLLRNVRRITRFLEKKQNAPINIKPELCQPPLKLTLFPQLTRSSTVVTNFPEPCPTCHFNQCELETHRNKLNLSIVFNLVKTLGEKIDKMQDTFKENNGEEEVLTNSIYPAD
jgi:hypothetical protein